MIWVLGTIALVLTTAPARAAETGPSGAPWCKRLADLRTYVEAMNARDTAKLDAMEDAGACAFLKPGFRVELTRTYLDGGPGTVHPVAVRVYGNETWVKGLVWTR